MYLVMFEAYRTIAVICMMRTVLISVDNLMTGGDEASYWSNGKTKGTGALPGI